MKDTYYFSHDYNARNDPKLQKVLMKLGQAGKGLYWDLVEMLFEEGGYLMLSECDSYAFALRSDSVCIHSLLNDFDLFKQDEERFWSESVLRRLNKRYEKSEKAAQSANKRWSNANALKNDANALRQECEGNAIKERKGKEIKVKPTIPAEAKAPSKHELFLILFNKLANRKFKGLDSKTKTQFDKLIKAGYNSEDFKLSVANGYKDSASWMKPQLFTPEYITRETNFLKYLNWQIETQKQERVKEPTAFKTIQDYNEYWGGPAKPITNPLPA